MSTPTDKTEEVNQIISSTHRSLLSLSTVDRSVTHLADPPSASITAEVLMIRGHFRLNVTSGPGLSTVWLHQHDGGALTSCHTFVSLKYLLRVVTRGRDRVYGKTEPTVRNGTSVRGRRPGQYVNFNFLLQEKYK